MVGIAKQDAGIVLSAEVGDFVRLGHVSHA